MISPKLRCLEQIGFSFRHRRIDRKMMTTLGAIGAKCLILAGSASGNIRNR